MNWLKGAAATGSGYASKYLQKFSRDNEGSFTVKKPDASSLTHERRGKNSSQEPSFDRSLSDGRFQESSVSSDVGDYSDNSNSICEASILSSPRRGSSLRSRRSNLDRLRPLSSLDSCLMAQLYREHAEMEENVVAPFSSPCTPAFRPFHVTDDAQLISRSRFDSFNLQMRDGKRKAHDQVSPKANEAVFGGIPRLPLIRSQEGLRIKNLKKSKDENKTRGSSQRMPNEMNNSSQGSPGGTVLFCIGVSVGVISSILANKEEVTKLHDLLKQTENLVQDLQEELVMKDSMTVKELVNEDNIFSFLNDDSTDVKKPTKPQLGRSDSDVATIHSVEASYTHKSTETIESMSMIEAELEAELERLELNMKKSAPCGCLSDDDEFDPDLVAEVVQGELRADMFTRNPSSDTSFDHHSSSVSTPCSQKQAFSPHELSLRLHQVIESRLEQRIMELESALAKSQKKFMQLQSEQKPSSLTELSSADVLSSSSSEPSSPMETQGYNEACMELNKINGSENEENVEMYKESEGKENFRSLSTEENITEDGLSVIDSRLNDESPNFPVDESEDEDDMNLLIKKILEKTKQGSPAILNAKAMVFLDNNEEYP